MAGFYCEKCQGLFNHTHSCFIKISNDLSIDPNKKIKLLEDLVEENNYITISLSKEVYIYILELIQKDIKNDN